MQAYLIVDVLIYPCKLLVVMNHGLIGSMNVTTDLLTTWLYKTLLTVINMQTNSVVRIKHPLKFIDAKPTLHWTTPNLMFPGMLNFQVFINLNNSYAVSILSRQSIIN